MGYFSSTIFREGLSVVFSALVELTLSANPRISAQGWARLSMAVANCTSLRVLMLDYNPLGDYSASCLLVAVSAIQNMEILDLEGCGLTEHTAQVWFFVCNLCTGRNSFLLWVLSAYFLLGFVCMCVCACKMNFVPIL